MQQADNKHIQPRSCRASHLLTSNKEKSRQADSSQEPFEKIKDLLFSEDVLERNLSLLFLPLPKPLRTNRLHSSELRRKFPRNAELEALNEQIRVLQQKERELRAKREIMAATVRNKTREAERLEKIRARLRNRDIYSELTASEMFLK